MSKPLFLNQSELKARAAKIRLLLLDVDGVLTDGRLMFSDQGEALKIFNTLDGHGIKLLRRSGVECGIITGRESPMVARRAADLGVHLLRQGREDKDAALAEILEEFPCELEHIAYLGDDWPDLMVMTRVGLALSVANAHAEVVARSHWQTRASGGQGAVREVCDLILRAQDRYQALLEPYLAGHE